MVNPWVSSASGELSRGLQRQTCLTVELQANGFPEHDLCAILTITPLKRPGIRE
jgi:hypothetical protein